jgi:hypothetical protein
MGGLNSGNIVQAGADSIGTSPSSYRFWTEDYPLGTVWEGPAISPGQDAFVIVNYNGNGTATYYLENETTQSIQSFTNSAPYSDGSTAEFINEKVGNSPIPNYGETVLAENVAGGSGCGTTLVNANNSNKINMTSNGLSSGSAVVDAGALNSYFDAFQVTWEG